jgi:hypothetical protein
MYQVGKYSASAVGGAGAAAGAAVLVAGAPAWATLLAIAVVGSAISYAVNIGIDAAVSWAFGSSVATPIVVTAPALNAGTVFPNQLVQGSDPVTLSLPASKVFYDPISINSGGSFGRRCISKDSMTHFACTQGGGPNFVGQYAQSVSNAPHCGLPHAGGKWGGAVYNQWGYPDQKMLSSPLVVGDPYTFNNFLCRGSVQDLAFFSLTTTAGVPAPLPEYAKNCGAGYAVIFDPSTGVFSPCTAFATSGGGTGELETTTKTLTQAVTALTSAQKAAKVDYQTMATLVNHVWQQAAAQPGYDGLPYSVTQPVTAANVQAWAQANPSVYPTVEALTAPVANAQTDFAPSTSTSPTTSTNPATTPIAPTATQPSTQTSQVNLGPDPNIGPPTLESTPTAQMILAPLIGLFPDLKTYSVPGHSGACPKPVFEVFGTSITMDQHCTIFEGQRSALYAAGLLAFTLLALFIVLSA